MQTAPRRKPHCRALVLASGALAIGSVAINCLAAVTFSPMTAKDLQDDLNACSAGGAHAGQQCEIDLYAVTYKTTDKTSTGPFSYISTATTGGLAIFGSSTANSILDGGNASQVLTIVSKAPYVTIGGLTIQNGNSGNIDGGGLAIDANASGNQDVQVINAIIRHNHSQESDGGLLLRASGAGTTISLEDDLIVNNSASAGSGAGSIQGTAITAARVFLSTIYGNTTTASGGSGGLNCCGTLAAGGSARIEGNIFWQNTNHPMVLSGASPLLQYDDWDGTVAGVVAGNKVPPNTAADPKFVNAANGNFHLAGGSPLFGYAPVSLANADFYDLDGNLYPYSGNLDIGAYNEALFDDSFEGN